MVGINHILLQNLNLTRLSQRQVQTLDIFDALCLDPETQLPFPWCSQHGGESDIEKILGGRVEHLLCSNGDHKTLALLQNVLFDKNSLRRKIWRNACEGRRDGYKSTWSCCARPVQDGPQTLVTRKETPLSAARRPPPREHSVRCPHCSRTRPEKDLDRHIRRNHKCPYCDTSGDDTTLRQHLREAYLFDECGDCDMSSLSMDHIQTAHERVDCPCGKTVFLESALQHLTTSHFFALCGPGCKNELMNEWDSHLEQFHRPLLCRILECERVYMDVDSLKRHLVYEHGLQMCSASCLGELHDDDNPAPWEHILRGHLWAKCDECPLYVQETALPIHLYSHGWVLCDICRTAVRNDDLSSHQQSHPQCPECLLHLLQASIDAHRIENHGLMQCPFCKNLFREITTHIFSCAQRPAVPPATPDGQAGDTTGLAQTILQGVSHGDVTLFLPQIQELCNTILQKRKPAEKDPAHLLENLTRGAASKFACLEESIQDPRTFRDFLTLPSDVTGRASTLRTIAFAAKSDTCVTRLIRYKALILLADTLDKTKRNGAIRILAQEFDKIAAHERISAGGKNRQLIKRDYDTGTHLRRFIGPFKGLLCFLSMVDNNRNYIRLKDEKLEEFHLLLKGYAPLWEKGARLLESLEEGRKAGNVS